ncbi:MAG: helix-turn-helix transcriptional regulator [Anaerococcus sp.]|nr:helix-turn-helix transcriptional regulator [Anaerococcus sp.]
MKKDINLMKEIPLTETAFLILLTMIKPNHGYGVMQDVESLTKGRVVFGPGTLYGAINNLEKKGWIELDFHDKNNRKKIYKTTKVGREILFLELERMQNLLSASNSLLKGV